MKNKVYKQERISGYFLYPTTLEFINETETIKGAVGLNFGLFC